MYVCKIVNEKIHKHKNPPMRRVKSKEENQCHKKLLIENENKMKEFQKQIATLTESINHLLKEKQEFVQKYLDQNRKNQTNTYCQNYSENVVYQQNQLHQSDRPI